MYNHNLSKEYGPNELTIGTLFEELSKYPMDTVVAITGETNYLYIMVEEDMSVVNLDVVSSESLEE